MTDYELLLQELGMTQQQVDKIVHNTADQVGTPQNALIELKDSKIHGKGVFATEDAYAGTTLCPARVCGFRTTAGRYTNHHPHPNGLMVRDRSGDIQLVALRDISKGSEVTINYRAAMKVR